VRRFLCISIVLAAAFGLAADATAADQASIPRASVTPTRGYTDSVEGVQIDYRLAGSAPADVAIRVVGSGREVRTIQVPGVQPGSHTEIWDGLTNAGVPVPDGTYKVMVGVAGGGERDAGDVTLYGHFFPVRGPHGTRGAVGEFGAGRNGGRTHKGFDVTGACGTPLAAVRSGTVVKNAFDGRLDGNFVVIRGLGERRLYLYAHMVRRSPFQQGDEIHVGQIVGHIGRTGNANSPGIPCHLHFEIHAKGRGAIDPRPWLRAWDRHS
jgi:murein DD-endopeptidase MepM/ murein hydrolase activator NlpD